jgi:Na+:H+ antiporter, NhaA family
MKEIGNQLWQLISRPVSKFLEEGILGGVLLLMAATVALVWANSPFFMTYQNLLHMEINLSLGGLEYNASLQHFINDGLMAIFFFVVGLEIKRELLVGELCEPKKALLPAVAAIGGMAVPAGIYAVLNADTPGIDGWGIPMATDIAFALGVMAILGNRVPFALKVFLLALAIFDDMGAILVIALFYGESIHITNLIVAGSILGVSLILNAKGVRKPLPYGILGVFLWLALLGSGIHATVAGVLLAMTIPARSIHNHFSFKKHTKELLRDFPETPVQIMVTDEAQREFMKRIKCSVDDLDSPLQKLEDSLHDVSNYIILPLFALANAGVRVVSGENGINFFDPVILGIFAGLVLGKPIGITLAVWLTTRIGLTRLPDGVRMIQILGIGCLGGIGFTMSIFVTNLAFVAGPMTDQAKVAILISSMTAAIIGVLFLGRLYKKKDMEIGNDIETCIPKQ